MAHFRTKHYSVIFIFFMTMMFAVAPNYSRGQGQVIRKIIVPPIIEKSAIDVFYRRFNGIRLWGTGIMTPAPSPIPIPMVVPVKPFNHLSISPEMYERYSIPQRGILINPRYPLNYVIPSFKDYHFQFPVVLPNLPIDTTVNKESHLINGHYLNSIKPIVNHLNANDSIVLSCLLKIKCKDITPDQRAAIQKVESCFFNKKGDTQDIVYSEMRTLAENAKKLFSDKDPDLEQLIRILSSPPIEPGRVFLNNGIDSMPQKSTKYRLDWR